MQDDSRTNIVPLPFLAATRAASEPARGRFGVLYGGSAPMRDVYKRIEKVAPTAATVLITGESGSGKELVARAIHDRSEFAQAPFVAVNCGAIPSNLIEADLFGYEKGAFTGAARQHRGCFERAEGGTLFLDEITEMAPEMQVRLLRVLETGRFIRIGGEEELRSGARIIAATNRDPRQAVAEGHLREDLMYRLAVFPIVLPPLRDREGDVDLLAEHFLRQFNEAEGTDKKFTRQAMNTLRAYSWPGNVRELRNAIQRAFILSDNLVDLDFATLGGASPEAEGLRAAAGMPLAEVERQAIYATLDLCGGNRRQCAEMLGVSLKTLYNRLAEYQGRTSSLAPA
jgi:DNA-binding NtrC family response regulator